MDQDTSSGLIQNKNLENTLQDAEEIEVNKKVTRAEGKQYRIQLIFDNLVSAQESLDRLKCDSSCDQKTSKCLFCSYTWSPIQTTQTKNSEKCWYKCRSKKCPARLQLTCSSITNGFSCVFNLNKVI